MSFNSPSASLTAPSVFLIHHGKQDYLRIAAQCSQEAGNDVILIGNDAATGQLCSAYYDDAQIPLPEYEAFERAYVHMSSATPEFELLCFKRYFYLCAIAKERNLKHFWMMDSDAIITQNLAPVADFLLSNSYCAAASTVHQDEHVWASSPHTSFWTLEGLEDFLRFLQNLYTGPTRTLLNQKYQYHQDHSIPGGICDMTGLYLWQKNKANVFNLAVAHLEGLPLFDNNLNQTGNVFDNEFEMVRNVRLKKITLREHTNYAHLASNQKAIAAAALHFQGTAKACMANFQKKREITYASYAGYAFRQYLQKRKHSLIRKLKKLIS